MTASSEAIKNPSPKAVVELLFLKVRKDKVTEWIWIGWCLCEVSEAQVQEKTSDEPYSRCTVCRKLVKELKQCSFISNKCQDATHPFSNLEEALASLKRDLEHTKSRG